MFVSTATPLSSMARSIAVADWGRSPCWYTTPTTTRFAAGCEPKASSATASASRYTWWRVRSSTRRPRVATSGKSSRATSATIAPVGTCVVETMAVVRSGSRRARLAGATPVRRSNTRKASALPSSSRAAPSVAPGPIRRCDTTGPPFWAMPVWSTLATSNPSRLAAVESTWPTVTTPVPPIPATRSAARPGRVGSGSAVAFARFPGAHRRAGGVPSA